MLEPGLPAVAAGMGLDTSSRSTFWPDRAAVELAAPVQHSFREAGVRATDHQAEMARFAKFAELEEAAGRPWCAEWAWIVPPIGGLDLSPVVVLIVLQLLQIFLDRLYVYLLLHFN